MELAGAHVSGQIKLGWSRCDYADCTQTPTITDGEFVMCTNHERPAYRAYGGPDISWRPITKIEPVPGHAGPAFLAHY